MIPGIPFRGRARGRPGDRGDVTTSRRRSGPQPAALQGVQADPALLSHYVQRVKGITVSALRPAGAQTLHHSDPGGAVEDDGAGSPLRC
jgi:hypothetical protein